MLLLETFYLQKTTRALELFDHSLTMVEAYDPDIGLNNPTTWFNAIALNRTNTTRRAPIRKCSTLDDLKFRAEDERIAQQAARYLKDTFDGV